ncbi:MAG: tRNA (adenosine(37)-N6)-dimethylallyltransferase MiaA [Anaerolineae bacterium]
MAGKPLIVILGPTAVGKTGFAIEVAQRVQGEIIGADSRQIYRHMDIGTAKPTPAEQAQARHVMIDVVDPDENLSVAQYQRMTYAHIEDMHTRGVIPLLVGGTGQYITAVTEGWSIPEVPPNEPFRESLFALAAAEGVEPVYQRLVAVDPEAAANIHPNNVRRVIRALEVYHETGTRFSDLQRKTPPPYCILELGLTLERPVLYERADTRVEHMMAAGFLDEVRRLLASGYSHTLPSMSGLGYAQLARHLVEGQPLEAAVADTKQATRHFIRRQYTWFRGHDNGIVWHNDTHTAIDTVLDWLNACAF